MKPGQFVLSFCFLIITSQFSNSQQVEKWLTIGPLPVSKPGFIDGKNVSGEDFEDKFILANEYLNLVDLRPREGDPLLWDDYRTRTWSVEEVLKTGFMGIKHEKSEFQIAYSAFYLESGGLNTYTCEVESPQMFEIFLDGKKLESNYTVSKKDSTRKKTASLKLDRGKFLILVKTMYKKGDENKWGLKANVRCSEDTLAKLDVSPLERMTIHHLLEGTKLGNVSISPDGTLIMVNYSKINTGTGTAFSWTEVKEIPGGRVLQSFRKAGTSGYRWMPSGKKLTYTLKNEHGSSVMVYDFETGSEYPAIKNIKTMALITWSDDEQFIIYGKEEEKEGPGKSSLRYMDELYNRTFRPYSVTVLYRYNVNTGVSTRLTFGERSANFNDLSPDGNYMVFATNRPNPTQRPFGLQNMYLMDLQTGVTKTLWADFRWSGSAEFSPDGSQLLVSGGPDLFGETGRNIGEQPMANNYDGQLYIYTINSGEVSPITREFNPSIDEAFWHPVDNRIYVKAAQEVYVRLFVWVAENNSFSMIPTVPDVMDELSIAGESLMAVYTGTSLGNPNKAWILDLQDGVNSLIDNTELAVYANVSFGESEDWDFKSSRGDMIRGYFLYPRNFDPSRKYPLIVNYYGGTNPIEKSFGGRYPLDIWAGEDYVVYVPQPSGATGFGQEFSARHQNNWGILSIDEIIEGTEKFIGAHDYVF